MTPLYNGVVCEFVLHPLKPKQPFPHKYSLLNAYLKLNVYVNVIVTKRDPSLTV